MTVQEIYTKLSKLSLFLAVGNMVWLVIGTAGIVVLLDAESLRMEITPFLLPYGIGLALFIGYWAYVGGIYFQKLLPGSIFLWGLTILFNGLLVLACLLIILWEVTVIFPASFPLLWGMLSIKLAVDIIRYEHYILSNKYVNDPEDFIQLISWE